MAAASKKRKAQDLGDHKLSKPSKKANKGLTNGILSPVSPTATDDTSHDAENSQSSATIPQDEEMLFKIECPASASVSAKKKRDNSKRYGPFMEDGGFPELAVQYAVRPREGWESMKQYRNFIVGEHKFSMGEHVYINHQPFAPPQNTNSDDLEFDRENNWIAKVLEVRARDPQHVYLRVFWLYWPEELPGGRQSYHGDREVVMSNHMEIVDAMTVAGKVDVTEWKEEDGEENVGQLFWRQKYNVKGNGKLSVPRRHCICNDHYNPDTTLLKCPSSTCGIWLHEACLIEDVLAKTYKTLVEADTVVASKDSDADAEAITVDTTPKKEGKKRLFPNSKLAELVNTATGGKLGIGPSNSKKAKGKKAEEETDNKGQDRPWEGKFTATIQQSDEGTEVENVKTVNFEITDERAQDPETWVEKVRCLKCHAQMD